MTGTRKEELARNCGIVYEEIGTCLSASGDVNDEVWYNVFKLCELIVNNPKSRDFDRSAAIFKQVLAEKRLYLEYAYISIIHALSRSLIGRMLLPLIGHCISALVKVRRRLLNRFR